MVATDHDRLEPEALAFPILAFDRFSFTIRRKAAELTTTLTSLIKSRWFDDLTIIDSAERTFVGRGVEILGGVGWLLGYNSFAGRRVRVRLNLHRSGHQLDIGEIKQRLGGILSAWEGWQSRDDYDDLVAGIEASKSIPELIAFLSRMNV